MVACAYLEGTYSELYPDVSLDETGLKELFRQFSFPGGIPSHAAPETPGSIHEGGELGYSLAHAYGAVFDNPGLLALASSVPTPVWGRDQLHAGEMWNSNSVVAWLIASSGLDAAKIRPPRGGRAPGWDAGLVVARR